MTRLARPAKARRWRRIWRPFDEIEANPMHQLIVVEDEGRVVGCCQLTILAGLSRGGARRALVEAVRVAPERRSQGIGSDLMAECDLRARSAGAKVIQLTTDKTRKRAPQILQTAGVQGQPQGHEERPLSAWGPPGSALGGGGE